MFMVYVNQLWSIAKELVPLSWLHQEAYSDAILMVYKQPGCTSSDVVKKVRSLLKLKKIGNVGTLYRLASGFLLLFIDRATK